MFQFWSHISVVYATEAAKACLTEHLTDACMFVSNFWPKISYEIVQLLMTMMRLKYDKFKHSSFHAVCLRCHSHEPPSSNTSTHANGYDSSIQWKCENVWVCVTCEIRHRHDENRNFYEKYPVRHRRKRHIDKRKSAANTTPEHNNYARWHEWIRHRIEIGCTRRVVCVCVFFFYLRSPG